ncbi:MAG: primase-helicase family protein [Burkholderiales bacterium]
MNRHPKSDARIKQGGYPLDDFYALPDHQILYVPTREAWPAATINARLPWQIDGDQKIPAAKWLQKYRAVAQVVWYPGEPQLICDQVLDVSGWARRDGVSVFNLYRPPALRRGNATLAGQWLDHVRKVYPDDADHIVKWLAHRVQHPGIKINHALVLGGQPGIGKDSLLIPAKEAVGSWNVRDIWPTQILAEFNPWCRSVLIVINEARNDAKKLDRVQFYERAKIYMASPPDVIPLNAKFAQERYVPNVCGVVITTNYAADGLYLPADDRRYYVADSPRTSGDFSPDYWHNLNAWFKADGNEHVAAYLASLDLSAFDPKAPPPKTPGFWKMVASSEAPELADLRAVIESMNRPHAFTLEELRTCALTLGLNELATELTEKKSRRATPSKLEPVGYVPVRNQVSEDGLFAVQGKRQAVYALRSLPLADQVRAAKAKA